MVLPSAFAQSVPRGVGPRRPEWCRRSSSLQHHDRATSRKGVDVGVPASTWFPSLATESNWAETRSSWPLGQADDSGLPTAAPSIRSAAARLRPRMRRSSSTTSTATSATPSSTSTRLSRSSASSRLSASALASCSISRVEASTRALRSAMSWFPDRSSMHRSESWVGDPTSPTPGHAPPDRALGYEPGGRERMKRDDGHPSIRELRRGRRALEASDVASDHARAPAHHAGRQSRAALAGRGSGAPRGRRRAVAVARALCPGPGRGTSWPRWSSATARTPRPRPAASTAGEPIDDLTQVAYEALMQALRRFDPDRPSPSWPSPSRRSSGRCAATSRDAGRSIRPPTGARAGQPGAGRRSC